MRESEENTMRKDAATKLITLLMALLLVVTLLPAGNVTAQAASKKPGAVTKVTKSEVNPTTVTIAYNKAKNAKGYQIRAYKGKKLVKSAKTKNTSYTVKGLSAETKYTIKVRAYNGSKYGKEKSITVKTETKNLAVTGLRASNVTKDSVKITYKKAKNAKGYQIRVYKGSKQVSGEKTGKTSYTVGKLSGGTKYTIKVRAYNGRKYGKEKSIIVTTSAPTDETEEPSSGNQNSGIVMPGESTSTGDALIAEYNAYVAYEAEQWKNAPGNNTVLERGPHGEWDLIPWSTQLGHMGAGIQYNEAYNDKYSMFKYKAGTANAVLDHTVDILNALGCNAERHDVANDAVRFPEMAIRIQYTTTGGIAFDAPNGERLVVIIYGKLNGGTGLYSLTGREESYTFAAKCPDCGKEMKIYIPKSLMASTLPTTLNGQTVNFNCSCSQYTKVYKFKLPYTVNDTGADFLV